MSEMPSLLARTAESCREARSASNSTRLSPAERRDLANALLRAAWSAALEETRILLLDLLVEVDDLVVGDAT